MATTSRTVMGNTDSSPCGTNPISRAIAPRGHDSRLRPRNCTMPRVGAARPMRSRTKVDFPAPFGPRMAVTPPPVSPQLTSRTASCDAPGCRKLTRSAFHVMSVIATPQQHDEYRYTHQRRQYTDGQFGRGGEGAGCRIGGDEENRAQEGGARQELAVIA